MVNFANEVRVENGSGALEAALEAGKTRLRPVLMTALAMIIGMLPMALALGEGGEQNAPLGPRGDRRAAGRHLRDPVHRARLYTLLRRAPPSAHALDEQFKTEAQGASSESLA